MSKISESSITETTESAPYVLNPELQKAILCAEITKRPLLLKGEPGTGKSLLAIHLAKEKKLPLYQWHVKSTSEAKDGLYFYDAVARLNDARFQEHIHPLEHYIRYGALGNAFLYSGNANNANTNANANSPCVVLIDEIDKADIEFPNDLLLELDRMEFYVSELNLLVKAKARPLVIITSNNEKELPDAFLRRCIFHYIQFPKPDLMKEIVMGHFPNLPQQLLQKAMQAFYDLRDSEDLTKKPTTSELVDWIKVLLHQGVNDWNKNAPPFLGALLKNENDYRR